MTLNLVDLLEMIYTYCVTLRRVEMLCCLAMGITRCPRRQEESTCKLTQAIGRMLSLSALRMRPPLARYVTLTIRKQPCLVPPSA